MMTVIAVIFCIWFGLTFLYMLAIMPRMFKRPDREPFIHVLYAHRGLHDNKTDAPENSMKAFEKAVEAGYGIELDIQLSRDHVPVIFHDFTLERVCGAEGKVCEYTYEELQQFRLCGSDEKIPRLVDVLRLVNGKVPLIIEFKVEWQDSELCYAAELLLQNYEGVYCIESFNPLVLFWYRRNNRKVMRGQLSDAFGRNGGDEYHSPLYCALENLLFNFLTKPDFIAYNHKFYKNRARCICRYVYGGLAAAWTIKSQEELDARREDFDLFIFDSFIPKEREDIKALKKSLEEHVFGQGAMDVEKIKQIVSEMDMVSPEKETERFDKKGVWNRICAVYNGTTNGWQTERLRKRKGKEKSFWSVAILPVTVAGAVFIGANIGTVIAEKKDLPPGFVEMTVFDREELPDVYKKDIPVPSELSETVRFDSIKIWNGSTGGYQVRYLDEQTEKYLLIVHENN